MRVRSLKEHFPVPGDGLRCCDPFPVLVLERRSRCYRERVARSAFGLVTWGHPRNWKAPRGRSEQRRRENSREPRNSI